MTLFSKKDKTLTCNFIAATLVDWHQDKTELLEKKLSRIMKKSFKTKNVSNNRINTFIVTTSKFDSLLDANHRIKIEKEVQKTFADYANTINKIYSKQIKYNKDTSVYIDFFNYLDKTTLKDRFLKNQFQKIDEIEKRIEYIISHASIAIWDLPGYQDDKIILPNAIANLSEDIDEPLIDMIDELLITNLAKYYLPFSKEMIDEAVSSLFQFYDLITKYDEEGVDNQTKKLLGNFIGTISGLQETLKLFTREIKQVDKLANTITGELQKLPSKELQNWIDIDFSELGNDLKNSLKKMDNLITEIKLILRKMLKIQNDEIFNFNDDIWNLIIDIKIHSNSINFWVNKFRDIPSFTTMENGIAYEKVENEKYIPVHEFLEVQSLFKTYSREENSIYALRGINFHIDKGEFLVIQGPSGSGKTTLLNILAGLDNVDRGAVFLNHENILQLKDNQRTRIRRDNFGFIFQSYALIPHLTAFENTKIPLDLSGLSKELQGQINNLLKDVGIGEYADHKPAFLSGGQMQRLSIARALIKKPMIIFADEPTGDLDEKTGKKVMDLFKKYHDETGVTIILVTHDEKTASYGTRRIFLKDGEIIKPELMN